MCRRLLEVTVGERPLQSGGNWPEVGLEPWLPPAEPYLDSCITAAVVHLTPSLTMEIAGTAQLEISYPSAAHKEEPRAMLWRSSQLGRCAACPRGVCLSR